MKLLANEKATLKRVLRQQIECESDMLKSEHDSFSHGDWLRFEADVKAMKSILKKLKAKK